MSTEKVLQEVAAERENQDKKWGVQDHQPVEWIVILGEEFGESSKAALEAHFKGNKSTGNFDDYRAELIQVAAVAVAAVESFDRQITRGCP